MKKITASLLGLAMSAAFAVSAQAENTGVYGGLSLVFPTYEESGFSDYDISYFQAQVGNRLNENFAVEMRVGHGMQSDSHTEGNAKFSLDAGFLVTGLAKAILPVGPVELYAVGGLTYSELTYEARNITTGVEAKANDDDTDFTYGAGVSYAVSDKADVFVEYINFYDKHSAEIAGFSLGTNFKF